MYSQAWPLKWLTSVPQWFWMTVVKSAAVNCPLDTQLGSWLYHTQLCPRRSCPFVFARFAICSPPENVNVPRVGSVASHFMLFAGVIWPNSSLLSRIAVYAVSESSPLSVAVPK